MIEPSCQRFGLHRSYRPRYELVSSGSITSQVIAWLSVLSHYWIAKELRDGGTEFHAQTKSPTSHPKRCVGCCGIHANAFYSGPIRTQSCAGDGQGRAVRNGTRRNETLRAGLGIGSPCCILERLDLPVKRLGEPYGGSFCAWIPLCRSRSPWTRPFRLTKQRIRPGYFGGRFVQDDGPVRPPRCCTCGPLNGGLRGGPLLCHPWIKSHCASCPSRARNSVFNQDRGQS